MAVLGVPGYLLGEELGRGGVGVVYAARRLADDSEWAVKLLRPELGPAHRELLRTEARRAGRVRHPGVLPVTEIGEQDGLTWLVMPRIDGVDLRRLLLDNGPLAPAEAAELIGHLAEAVAAVHAAGLVHRDIKPANVLVRTTEDGGRETLLTDLGIAAPPPATPGPASGDSLFSVVEATGEPDWTSNPNMPSIWSGHSHRERD